MSSAANSNLFPFDAMANQRNPATPGFEGLRQVAAGSTRGLAAKLQSTLLCLKLHIRITWPVVCVSFGEVYFGMWSSQ